MSILSAQTVEVGRRCAAVDDCAARSVLHLIAAIVDFLGDPVGMAHKSLRAAWRGHVPAVYALGICRGATRDPGCTCPARVALAAAVPTAISTPSIALAAAIAPTVSLAAAVAAPATIAVSTTIALAAAIAPTISLAAAIAAPAPIAISSLGPSRGRRKCYMTCINVYTARNQGRGENYRARERCIAGTAEITHSADSVRYLRQLM